MNFREALQKQVLILDGAMGTMVQRLELSDQAFGGPDFKMLTDLLVFARPEDLENIHLEYLKAGANLLETNTFGASPLRLKEFDFKTIDPSGMKAIPEGFALRGADVETLSRHLNFQACKIARKAIEHYQTLPEYDGRPLFVAGSVGPSNYVVSSTQADLNKATFREIVDNAYHQALGLIDGGADVLLYETQQDILELKAELIGAQKALLERKADIPIMAQVTVDEFGKMQIFNTDIQAAYVAVAGMGIDVFGLNCNVGPVEMAATAEKLSKFCNHPLSFVPNAGQPISQDGQTCYKLTPDEMVQAVEAFVDPWGASIIGGCCGTTPEHIRALRDHLNGRVPLKREMDRRIYLSGPQEAVELDSENNLIRIGERLNVRGSNKVREAVEGGEKVVMETLDEVVTEQVSDLGLDIIDVCMDSNIVETEKVFPRVIHELTSDFKGVMCLDSFSVEALDAAIQMYPGRPIINSISLEEYREGQSKLDAVLSITHQHHPIYIALVNGAEGPAQTVDEKFNLAKEIVDQAADRYGVGPDQILIDVNAYPIGSESVEGLNFCTETLESLPRIKAIHPDLKTTIGIGNLTNGLAQKPYMRKVLTSVFLDEARRKGLDCAILNPHHYVPIESLPSEDVDLARNVILKRDMVAFEKLEEISLTKSTGTVAKKVDYDNLPLEDRICRKIMHGFKQKEEGVIEKDGGSFPYRDRIVLEAAQAIEKHKPLDFISDYLMKTMRELGDRFGRGEVSLPHLLKSADVMRSVMQFLETYMRFKTGVQPGEAMQYKGTIVIGTVYQDVHSIGKDLAKTLLENYGYRVIDLGVQEPLDRYIETARKEKADAIGLSALLVQTSNHMITVSRMLRQNAFDFPLLIGGAPVSHRHAGYVGMWGQNDLAEIRDNVFYCESAMDGVNTLNIYLDKDRRSALLEENKKHLMEQYQRAKGLQTEKDNLIKNLKRRKIHFKGYEKPVNNFGVQRIEFKLHKLHLDTKSLYSLNWKFGKQSSWKQKGINLEDLKKLNQEWVAKAEENRWIVPRAIFGLFPAQSEEDELILYDPIYPEKEIGRLQFTLCIGKGRKDKFSVAQYFHSRSSGIIDVAGLLIATSGREADVAVTQFKENHDTESALYLQGLGDRTAEDLTEYIHNLLRQRAGYKKGKSGQRYSPGYPALESLKNNDIDYEILGAGDIGVSLTGAHEFDPASTTGCIICFHPHASYT